MATDLDSLARRATEVSQPVVDVKTKTTSDPNQTPPAQKPMPAPLNRACGDIRLSK